MRKMKKLVILVLACLCVMACALGFASCEDETSNQSVGLSFVINEDGESYSVRGIGVCEERDIVIPATYKNKPVTGIELFCFCVASINSVTIPDGVTTIGSGAFYGCNSLTSIVIPNSVNTIGEYAFSGCDSLTSVIIPNSVTTIGTQAFYNCSRLTSVTIGNSVTSIGDSAFLCCDSLTNVVIPDSVTSIGDSAFRDCDSLINVTMGNNVTAIGDSAFQFCDSLTSVYITDIVAWCNISFGNYSANPLTVANNLYLNKELVTELIIPDGVTTIGDCAFVDCNSLTSIVIPNSVTTIGRYAFWDCDSLTSITFTGTYAQWEAIQKGYNWNDGVPAEKVICLGGTVEL